MYTMERYGADLVQHTYTNVFQQLNIKYDQLTHPERPLDDLHSNSSVAVAAKEQHLRRYRRDDRDLDRDEESYFSENDGDDDMIDDTRTSGGGASASLADESPSRDQFQGSGMDPKITASGGAAGADHNDRGDNDEDPKKANAAPPLLGLIEYDSDEESPGKTEGED